MKKQIYARLFVAVILLFVAATLIPGSSTMDFTNFIANTVLVVAVFTFGMMLAYSVSNRQNRLDKIREQLREQDAMLLNIYDFSKAFDKSTVDQVRDRIDQYLQVQIDYPLQEFDRSHNALRRLSLYLMDLKPKSKRQEEAKGKILDNVEALTGIHKRVCYHVQNKMLSYEWVSLFLLGAIIIFSLFHENQNTWPSIVIVTVVSSSLILFLLILRELDSLEWQEHAWIWRPLTSLFIDLDLLPYFPEDVFTTKRLKFQHISTHGVVKRIRVACYPAPYQYPYPSSADKRIEVVDIPGTLTETL